MVSIKKKLTFNKNNSNIDRKKVAIKVFHKIKF